jgi:hypothetical protein
MSTFFFNLRICQLPRSGEDLPSLTNPRTTEHEDNERKTAELRGTTPPKGKSDVNVSVSTVNLLNCMCTRVQSLQPLHV